MEPEQFIKLVNARGFVETLEHFNFNYLEWEDLMDHVRSIDPEMSSLMEGAMDSYREIMHDKNEWHYLTKNYERPGPEDS